MRPASVKLWLILIIAFAAIFYFYALGRNDVVTDEASYMARGIGILDFNFGIEQPTPWQWVKEVPLWMKLSFHDHPPLVFLLERASIGLFGETPFAGRISSAFAGLVSIFFIFLIAKELYSSEVGLVSAALFAFTVNRVWISRVALQESVLIALMLAAAYCFIRSLLPSSIPIGRPIGIDEKYGIDHKQGLRLIAAGALLGLAMLAKYTAFILAPIFLTILALRRRDYFLTKEFAFSILLFLVVISPVIIYNIGLYQTFGHFDFQLSYIFGQKVGAWASMPGKEDIGSLTDRLEEYLPTLLKTNSPLFILFALFGLLLASIKSFHLKLENKMSQVEDDRLQTTTFSDAVLGVFLAWFAVSMLVIGPTERFLTMLTPWLAIFAGAGLVFLGRRFFFFSPAAAKLLLILLLIGEAAYAYNSVVAVAPLGKSPWTYAAIRSENGNWGFNQLENFLAGELRGKRPEYAVSFNYPAIAKALNEAVAKDIKTGLEPVPWAIVYNGNINLGAQLWTFLRRGTYHGWPVVDADTYHKILSESGSDYFKELGIEKVYFINSADKVLLRGVRTRPLTDSGDVMEAGLRTRGITPREIKNLRGEVAFRLYEFAP